jgi:hypothetical protein
MKDLTLKAILAMIFLCAGIWLGKELKQQETRIQRLETIIAINGLTPAGDHLDAQQFNEGK